MLNSPLICCGSSKTLAAVAAEPGSFALIAAGGGSFLPFVPDAPDIVERNAPRRNRIRVCRASTFRSVSPWFKASQYILFDGHWPTRPRFGIILPTHNVS